MIDLNKSNKQSSSVVESSFIEKDNRKSTDIPDHNDIKLKEKNARKFLCVLLAMVVVFVSVVCIFVNRRNKILLAQQKIDAVESTVSNAPENEVTPTENTQSTPSSALPQATQAAATVKVQKPGTMDNPTIIKINKENWHLTLVNAGYRIPDSYEPDLVYVCDSSQRLDRKVAEAYEKMYAAALKDGATLTPHSGYRSYDLQEKSFDKKVNFYLGQGLSKEEAIKQTATRIMPPGSSEHNLGYAMDIVCADAWFKNTKEFNWLQENAQDYGFILRYPEDKTDITGVIYEPWHWRYVGVEAAKEMKENNQVLEEYLGVVK